MRRNGSKALAGSSGSVSRSNIVTSGPAAPSTNHSATASADDSTQQEAEISALLKASSSLVQWSQCGRFLAAAHSNRLTIREKSTLQILQQYSAADVIQSIAWSDDSQLVSTAMYKRALVQIWSVKDSSWTCKINEGVAGMVYGKWTPDSRHFITISDFQLHATVWSLTDGAKYVIRNPKLSAEGFSFSPDSELLAVAERHDCKDFIGIYNCESWELVTHFPLESYDCVEIGWSPDNTTIAVRDSHLEFRVLVYAVNGTLLSKYQAYEHALGLKAMEWSTSGQFLALGSFDDHLRVLSHLNWKPIADFDHEAIAITMMRVNKTAIEFEEQFADQPIINRPQGKRIAITLQQSNSSLLSNSSLAASAAAKAAGGRKSREICFIMREPPFSVLITTPDPLKENPKMGISRVSWSSDSAFMATKSDQMPHNVWIWQTETMTLHAVVTLIQPVRNLRWDPVQNRLALVSGENRVYLWAVGGVSWVDIPVARKPSSPSSTTLYCIVHSSISSSPLESITAAAAAQVDNNNSPHSNSSVSPLISTNMQKALLVAVALCLVLAVLQFEQVDAHFKRHRGKGHKHKSHGKKYGRRLTGNSYDYGNDDYGHRNKKKHDDYGYGYDDYGYGYDDYNYGSDYDYGNDYDNAGYGGYDNNYYGYYPQSPYSYGGQSGYGYGYGYTPSYSSYYQYSYPGAGFSNYGYQYSQYPEAMTAGNGGGVNLASGGASFPTEQASTGAAAPAPTPAATGAKETAATPAKKTPAPAAK